MISGNRISSTSEHSGMDRNVSARFFKTIRRFTSLMFLPVVPRAGALGITSSSVFASLVLGSYFSSVVDT